MLKINKYKQTIAKFLSQLNDVRFVGQIVFVVIILLISWSGVKSIQSNYSLEKQISALQQQNNIQQLQNDNLKLQNEYYKTNQYLELSARQNFGLAAPGEKEIIVPASVALAHTVNLPTASDQATAASKKSAFQSNFDSWVNFFLHRPNTDN
jgi:cell division protein FtsB